MRKLIWIVILLAILLTSGCASMRRPLSASDNYWFEQQKKQMEPGVPMPIIPRG